MTQLDLKDYLLHPDFDCEIYDERKKEDGLHFFIRNKKTKYMKVVYPIKKGTYAPAAVSNICISLNVPTPDYAKHMDIKMNKIINEEIEIPQDVIDEFNKINNSTNPTNSDNGDSNNNTTT